MDHTDEMKAATAKYAQHLRSMGAAVKNGDVDLSPLHNETQSISAKLDTLLEMMQTLLNAEADEVEIKQSAPSGKKV